MITHGRRSRPSGPSFILFAGLLIGCATGASTADSGPNGAGGAPSTGGGSGRTGGTGGEGGSATETGGSIGSAGATGKGGVSGSGGLVATGGRFGSGGASGGHGGGGPGGAVGSGGSDLAGRAGGSGQGGRGGAAGGGVAGSTGSGGHGTVDAGATDGPVIVNGGTGAASFHCVNWAVNGDNYQAGPLVLSAMRGSSDSYAQVQGIANLVLGSFISELQANCVRVPINEPTATTSWWSSYKAVIDAATAKGMKVMIGYWVKDGGHGQPYDTNAFFSMWKVVVQAYASNPLVYYDLINEPFAMSQSSLTQLAQSWISMFPSVPKGQVIVPGTGWDDNVTGMGAAFPGYLLELHIYAIGKTGPLTDTAWASDLASVVGQYSNRTIVGEWGDGVAGVNYDSAVNNNLTLAYVDGVSNQIHDAKMGSGWWPGLWAGPGSGAGNNSSWSMLLMNGSWPNYTFSVQNQSALKRLQHSWGLN